MKFKPKWCVIEPPGQLGMKRKKVKRIVVTFNVTHFQFLSPRNVAVLHL